MAPFELALVSALASTLANLRWGIQKRDPASLRPDIVVTRPDGKTFVVEIKMGEGPVHFASIAQVESYAHELGALQGREVIPILVTNQELAPALSAVAEKVGVEVVKARGSTADEITESVVSHLQSDNAHDDPR
jgi:predicted RecB family endonuclease